MAGIAASLAAAAHYAWLARHNEYDDALIYARYVRNALGGAGLVYNPGERVNALTSPLYAYLSLAAAYLVGDVPASQVLLGGVFLFLTAATVILVFHRQGLAPYGAVAGLAIVTQGYFYWTFGMETTLFLFLASLSLLLWLERRTRLAAVAAGLLTITRAEGVLLLAILAVAHYRRHRRAPPAGVGVAVATVVAAPIVFNLWYYGQALSHTFAAKIAQGRSGLWGEGFLFLQVGYVFHGLLDTNPLLVVVPGVLVACSTVRWLRTELSTILLVYLAAYSLLYVGLNVPNYHWYYAIYFFAAAFFAAHGLAVVADGLARLPLHLPCRARLTAATTLLVAGLLLGTQAVASERWLRTESPPHAYRAIGLWLRDHTPAASTLACVEIGILGWYSERYIVDIVGLVSPPNARLLGRRDFAGWTRFYTPDYILIHDPLWPHEGSVQALLDAGVYAPVPDFPFAGYRLLSRPPAEGRSPAGLPGSPG